jgi:acyl-CoA reductase-like NAD-dependent aldehyde dehydrogenase
MGLLEAVERYEKGELTAAELAAFTKRTANRMIEQARTLVRLHAQESLDRALHGDVHDQIDSAMEAAKKSSAERPKSTLRLLPGGKS